MITESPNFRFAVRLLLCGLTVAAAVTLAILEWQHGQATLQWQPTPGKVTRRDMKTEPRAEPIPMPRIHVEYSVAGSTHELIVEDDFVLDSPLRVYYDPAEPSHAVLRPGVDRGWMLACIVVACLAAIAFAVNLVLLLRPDWQSEESLHED